MRPEPYSKLLSICIPSYNRGHRAIELVRQILSMDCVSGRNDIEIIVSDNGSTEHTDGYDEIAGIGAPVVFNRFDENKDYYGNYNKVVKMSDAHYCLLISDEDGIDEAVLTEFIAFLEKNPDAGLIRTGTSSHYTGIGGGLRTAGEEALKSFYLSGNYISGSVYNRDHVRDELIDGLLARYDGDEGYFYYPHLFVEAYVMNLADFYFFEECLILEGKDEGDMPKAESVSVPVFASWESRVRQLAGYFKLIRDLGIDDGRKQLMFMMAVCKTISLIALVKEQYVLTGAEWSEVFVAAGNAILDAAASCGIKVINDNMEAYLQVCADFIRKDMA